MCPLIIISFALRGDDAIEKEKKETAIEFRNASGTRYSIAAKRCDIFHVSLEVIIGDRFSHTANMQFLLPFPPDVRHFAPEFARRGLIAD